MFTIPDDVEQERMLKRYQVLKLQREQRHQVAAARRKYLEEQRRYKILSSNPELAYIESRQAWQEEEEDLLDQFHRMRLLNQSPQSSNSILFEDVDIMDENSVYSYKEPPASDTGYPVTDTSSLRHHSMIADSWPPSPQNTPRENVESKPPEEPPVEKVKYRLSLRLNNANNEDGDEVETVASMTSVASGRSRPSTATASTRVPLAPSSTPLPLPSSTPRRQKKSAKDLLMANRPRSSASIPAKTRFILLKNDPPQSASTSRSRNPPTKLEETLLRKRFPAQHRKLMRNLARTELGGAETPTTTTTGSIMSGGAGGVYDSEEFSDDWERTTTTDNDDVNFDQLSTIKSAPLITVLHRKKSTYMPAAFRA